MAKESGVEVTADGPYAVRGIPVAAGRIVRTARGEAIDWDVDEPYETGRLVLLCRCGRSKTKPFCDDSHLEGFDAGIAPPIEDDHLRLSRDRDAGVRTPCGRIVVRRVERCVRSSYLRVT